MSGENLVKGTGWVANLSRLSYDFAKNHIFLLKMKEKSLVDDEVNWLQASMLALLRQTSRLFFGEGSPNSGLQIVGTGAVNDFTIKAGHIMVDGWLVNLAADTTYSAQAIAQVGLTTPGIDRTDKVYLDVWLDEVTAVQDPTIVDPTLNTPTSTRLKFNWAIKVAEGGVVPADGLGAGDLYHWYYHLATLSRLAGNTTITAGMVADARGRSNQVYLNHAMATAENDFLVASGAGAFVKRTLAQVKTILGLGDAAYKNTGTVAGTVAAGDHGHTLATVVNAANGRIVHPPDANGVRIIEQWGTKPNVPLNSTPQAFVFETPFPNGIWGVTTQILHSTAVDGSLGTVVSATSVEGFTFWGDPSDSSGQPTGSVFWRAIGY
jgi:hypothetical protein